MCFILQYRVHEEETTHTAGVGIGTGVRTGTETGTETGVRTGTGTGVGTGVRTGTGTGTGIVVSSHPPSCTDEMAARREEIARATMEGITAEMLFTQPETVQHAYVRRGEEGKQEMEGTRDTSTWVGQTVCTKMDTIVEEPEPRFRDEEEYDAYRDTGSEEDCDIGEGERGGEGDIDEGKGGDKINRGEGSTERGRETEGGERAAAEVAVEGKREREGVVAAVPGIAESLLGPNRASKLRKVTVSEVEIDTHVSHILNFSFPRSTFGSDLWQENR